MPHASPLDLPARHTEATRLHELVLPDGTRTESPVGSFITTHGSSLVFSAPHEMEHTRDATQKHAEGGTGALAARLAALTGGSSIRTDGTQNGDPNWDDPHPYAEEALRLAAGGTLVDLHMMLNRGFEVCLGLGPDPSLNRHLWLVLVDELLAADVRVSLNWPFGAKGRTLTTRALRAGIPAVQIEMVPEAFDPTSDVFACVVSALGRASSAFADPGN